MKHSCLALAALILCLSTAAGAEVYRSPLSLVAAPDDRTLYAADRTAECLTVLDLAGGQPPIDIALAGEPWDTALSADGKTLYVSLRKAGKIAVIDTQRRAVERHIDVGPWPVGMALAEKRGRLFVCCRGDHTLVELELPSGKRLASAPMVRDPFAVAVTPDETRLVVTNYMPLGAGNDPTAASELTIVDASTLQPVARIKMPPGTTMLGGVATSHDGRWAYAVHTVGRFLLPITQLDRGWVHTYAVSIIDVAGSTRLATLLLDDMSGGAADPWDVVVSRDDKTLVVSHAGVHELSVVNIGRVHELLDGRLPPEVASLKDGTRDNVWARIGQDRKAIGELTHDLTALHLAGAIRRVPSGGVGPRGLALSPAGGQVYAANYYSGTIASVEFESARLAGTRSCGAQPPAGAARRGEIYFHDATRCFQRWHSCFSCHLDDGRTDGLTWDFMRDGIGNGKDVISLVGVMNTSPHNRRATRPDPRECMRTGVIGSHLVVPNASDVDDLLAYVATLQPEPNPQTAALAEAVARGKTLFEGKAHCAGCHPAPLFTDKKQHDVGIHTSHEPDGRYDTPSLVECYRTGPYLHDGRAASLNDLMTVFNPDDRHGRTKDLTPQELADLAAYLLSL
jgi:YVTN family beta-propeller protein